MLAKCHFRLLLFTIIFFPAIDGLADTAAPRVPSQMDFAGMKLKITDAARSDIQQQVDALRASDRYFRLRLDLVLLYFPIIERVMKEENLPDDIKYLVIQESGLVSDAVSSSNAVGFWMFKEPAGREVGLRIDKYVDERLNIVSSTRGACKYIKRHNFFFNNWVYSVIAHNTGKTGAEKHVSKSNFGADKMTIDKDTHWYFKTFLAHMIAFQDELGGRPSSGLELREYTKGADKPLDKISKELKADEALVFQYNKWLKRGPVPSEKEYSVIIPVQKGEKVDLIAKNEQKHTPASSPSGDSEEIVEPGENAPLIQEKYPDLKKAIDSRISSFIMDINGIPAIIATKSDDLKTLAAKSGVDVAKLEKYNDLRPNQALEEGQVYYLKNKHSKSNIYYHTVRQGETLWEVSQEYGIKLNQLARKNRMFTIDKPEVGRVLWLRQRRPSSVDVEIKDNSEDYLPAIVKSDPAPPPRREPAVVVQEEEIQVAEAVKPFDEEPALATEELTFDEQEEPEPMVNASNVEQGKKEDRVLTPANEAARDIHIVNKGETLYGIARHYGVTKAELQQWNDLSDNSILSIGQELLLIKRDTSDVKEVLNPSVLPANRVTVHVVQPGETMYSIARKYDIAIEKLMKMNDKSNFVLSIGENLKVTD
jgi:membrane-bound lytic murein transglycosylase D